MPGVLSTPARPVKRKQIWCTLVPKPVAVKLRKGQLTDRQHELQVSHTDVDELGPRCVGIPILYNHKQGLGAIGSVKGHRKGKAGQLQVKLEMTDETPLGEAVLAAVEECGLDAVSLRHVPAWNKPDEVSICILGARGPLSVIHKEPNGLYTRDGEAPHTVLASDADDTFDEEQLTIYPVCEVVEASMEVFEESGATSPAAAGVALPGTKEAAAAGAGAATFKSFQKKDGSTVAFNVKPPTSGEDEEMKEAAPVVDESKVAEVLPVYSQLNKVLMNEKEPPTEKDKAELADTVMNLEMEADKIRTERAKLQKEVEELRKTREREAEVRSHTQRMLGDAIAAAKSAHEKSLEAVASSPEHAQKLKAVFASLTEEQKTAQMELLTAPRQDRAIRDATGRKIQRFLKERAEQASYKAPPVETPSAPQQQQAPRTEQSVMASLVPADEWGMKLDCIPTEFTRERAVLASASMGVQSSARMVRERIEREASKGKFEPGAGLNFDWSFMRGKQPLVFLGLSGPPTAVNASGAFDAPRTTADVGFTMKHSDYLSHEGRQLWGEIARANRIAKDRGMAMSSGMSNFMATYD